MLDTGAAQLTVEGELVALLRVRSKFGERRLPTCCAEAAAAAGRRNSLGTTRHSDCETCRRVVEVAEPCRGSDARRDPSGPLRGACRPICYKLTAPSLHGTSTEKLLRIQTR
jgi:hypothetical protein